MIEDTILVRKFKNGDQTALGRLYDKYGNSMLTVATNLLGDPCAAEDIVQDVFVSFVQSIDGFELRGSLKAFFLTCVANRCRDGLRKIKRQRGLKEQIENQLQQRCQACPSEKAMLDEESERAAQALLDLPIEQKEAIVLRLNGDMKFRTIAAMQGVSVKTALSRYRYGIERLRNNLEKETDKCNLTTTT